MSDMAEKELYNNHNAKPFPFEYVRKKFGKSLAEILLRFDREDTCPSRPNFVTALNAILVWCGARTATLPSWQYVDKERIDELVDKLNEFGRQVSPHAGQVDELMILLRPRLYRSGPMEGIQPQALIARKNCSRVRLTTDPPIGDEEIGRELDMYHPNTQHFASEAYDFPQTGFSVWEVWPNASITNSLLFAETWSANHLSNSQIEEFIVYCNKRVSLWNSSMEKLGLPYRFIGTMSQHGEMSWQEHSKKWFG